MMSMNGFNPDGLPKEEYKEEHKESKIVQDENKQIVRSQDINNLEQKKYDLERNKYNLEKTKNRISVFSLLVTFITVIVLFGNYINGKSQLNNAIEQTKQNQTKIENESAFNKKRLNTEMFSRATEQLGKSDEASETARIGAIYTLEQIAKDSPEDHWKIMELLTFYVREKDFYSGELEPGFVQNIIRDDVQIILDVIGRRNYQNDPEGKILDFAGIELPVANFSKAHLKTANFSLSQLLGASFNDANLQGASFRGTDLRGASFKETDLKGADICKANLRQVRNLTVEQVKSAKNWEGATYDDDFRRKLGLSPQESGLPACLKASK